MFSLCHSVSSFPPPLPHLPFLKQDFSFSITSQDMYFSCRGKSRYWRSKCYFFFPLWLIKGQVRHATIILLSLGSCLSFQFIHFLCFDSFYWGFRESGLLGFPTVGFWLSGPSSSRYLIPKMRLEKILKMSPFKFAYHLSLIYSSVNVKPWANPPFINFSGKK